MILLCYWANLHCYTKWPNIEQIIKPSCHTDLKQTSSVGPATGPLLQGRDRQGRDEEDLFDDLLRSIPEKREEKKLDGSRHVPEELGDEVGRVSVKKERLGVGDHQVEQAELDQCAFLKRGPRAYVIHENLSSIATLC